MNTRVVIFYFITVWVVIFVLFLAVTDNPVVSMVIAGLLSFFSTITAFKSRK